jgi:two-component system cell cycle sensor histidine kinase/response regulator CckA
MTDRDGTSSGVAPTGPGSPTGEAPSLWRRLERALFEPRSQLLSPEERSRLRILALFALSGILLAGAIDVAFWMASERYVIPWYLYLVFVLAYVCGRLGYRRVGALLLVYSPSLLAVVRLSTRAAYDPLIPLMNLAIAPLAAAILLAWQDVALLVAVEAALPVVLVAVVPHAFPRPAIAVYPVVLTVFVGGLVVALMRQRDRLEQLRRQDLQAREEHYRALVSNVPGVVYRLAGRAGDRRVTYLSDGTRSLTGFDPPDLLAGRPALSDLIHPDDRERVRSDRERGLTERRAYALEYRLLRRDGGARWVLDRGHEVRGQDDADCVDGVLIDISERRFAIAEQERLAAIVEATSDLVSTAQLDGALRYMNRAGRRLLGWAEDADIGLRHIPDAHPPWARKTVEEEGIPAAIRTGVWAGETAILGPDGREIPVSQVIMAHRSAAGDLEFLSTIIRDISDRMAAESEHKESEERFRLLAGAAFEGIAITAQGRVVDANEQLCAMLRAERDQIVGRSALDFVASESLQMVLAHLRSGSEEPYEHMAQRADGSVFPVEVRARTIPSGGHPQRVTALRDLTERKRLEDERAELERQAQHNQRLESLGLLAGGIAHDFNNLLVAVLGNLDLAAADLAPDAPQRRQLEQAEHAAKQGAALARELLAYSGRGRFDVRPLDLSALVAESGHLLRAAISKTIRLEMRLQNPLPLIMGDASQLQQVVMNLIVNAAEAVGEKGGAIVLSTRVEECDAVLLGRSRLATKPAPGSFVCLEVMDDGCGMEPETLERLFEPFFSTKLAGRGLGMAAVQGIVQGHKGAILVDTSPARGTTSRIFFPAAAGSVDAVAPPSPVPAPARRAAQLEPGGLVMVVDDEAMVRSAAQAMLEHLGFSVVTAADGSEALDLFRRIGSEVALVILDLTMPEMDGLETLTELRRERPDLPVLLASGFDETEISARCGSQRPDGFLEKPYRLATLETAVQRVLLG